MKKRSAALMLSGAMLAFGVIGPANASTFTYTSWTYDSGVGVTISGATTPGGSGVGLLPYDGSKAPANGSNFVATSVNITGYADQNTNSIQTYKIWCIDAYDDLQSPTTTFSNVFTYNGTQTLTNEGYGSGAALSTAQIGQIGALITHANPTSGYWDAATQIAIWDVEYNGGKTANSPFAGSGVNAADVNTLLTDSSTQWAAVTNLKVFEGPGNQTMVSAVPIPGALPLFGGALAGLGVLARRRARKTAKVG
jgi:hypothetical protein